MSAKFPNNDDMEVDSDMEPKFPTFFKGWFIFVAMLVLTGFAFGMYIVWQLLGHFGVVA